MIFNVQCSNVNIKDKNRKKALDYAKENDNVEAIKILEEYLKQDEHLK